MGSLILAVRFLTVVPVPGREAADVSALGRAAWWFPVVGLLLGEGLAGAFHVLHALFPPLVAAALLVTVWKAVTGGIHLDGLADALDGLAGPDPARRLAIMRDSRIGVFGAAGLVLCLLLAVTAVADLSGPVRARLLVLAPVVGRAAPLLVGAWLRPATPGEGLGAAFAAGLSRWAGPLAGLGSLALGTALLGPWGAAIAAAGWGAAGLWAGFAARRLGGLTGDVLGAVVELAELGVLLAGAAVVRRGLL
jgi:adenosylcobinamide-GDP ribazoletransferase